MSAILDRFLKSRLAACLTHAGLAAMTVGYFAVLLYLPFWIAFVPGVILAHRIGTLLHEYMHGIPFRRYRDNHAVVTLFDGGMLMFGTLEMFRVSHLLHHRWLNNDPDSAREKSNTLGQRTADVIAGLQLFQYLARFPGAIRGEQPQVRRKRVLISALLSVVTIWAWTAVGRPDVAWKMVIITLATMLGPVSLRSAIEHHDAPGHPHFANEYRVWIPLFNLNRHIHHHEDPTIPWYRLQWQTERPLSRSHSVLHWIHVHVMRDFVLMRPMGASDAAPRTARPGSPDGSGL